MWDDLPIELQHLIVEQVPVREQAQLRRANKSISEMPVREDDSCIPPTPAEVTRWIRENQTGHFRIVVRLKDGPHSITRKTVGLGGTPLDLRKEDLCLDALWTVAESDNWLMVHQILQIRSSAKSFIKLFATHWSVLITDYADFEHRLGVLSTLVNTDVLGRIRDNLFTLIMDANLPGGFGDYQKCLYDELLKLQTSDFTFLSFR